MRKRQRKRPEWVIAPDADDRLSSDNSAPIGSQRAGSMLSAVSAVDEEPINRARAAGGLLVGLEDELLIAKIALTQKEELIEELEAELAKQKFQLAVFEGEKAATQEGAAPWTAKVEEVTARELLHEADGRVALKELNAQSLTQHSELTLLRQAIEVHLERLESAEVKTIVQRLALLEPRIESSEAMIIDFKQQLARRETWLSNFGAMIQSQLAQLDTEHKRLRQQLAELTNLPHGFNVKREVDAKSNETAGNITLSGEIGEFCDLLLSVGQGQRLAGLFDDAYYLEQHPDVKNAVSQRRFVSGLEHWLMYGARERRTARLTDTSNGRIDNGPGRYGTMIGAFRRVIRRRYIRALLPRTPHTGYRST
jgi:hypothetical protein